MGNRTCGRSDGCRWTIVFAEHVEQAALPLAFLYFPAVQAVQAEPSTPVYPGTQVQSFHHDERGGEAVNAGQELSTPVQHHVLGLHGEQAALATP